MKEYRYRILSKLRFKLWQRNCYAFLSIIIIIFLPFLLLNLGLNENIAIGILALGLIVASVMENRFIYYTKIIDELAINEFSLSFNNMIIYFDDIKRLTIRDYCRGPRGISAWKRSYKLEIIYLDKIEELIVQRNSNMELQFLELMKKLKKGNKRLFRKIIIRTMEYYSA